VPLVSAGSQLRDFGGIEICQALGALSAADRPYDTKHHGNDDHRDHDAHPKTRLENTFDRRAAFGGRKDTHEEGQQNGT
jgi:hypothetical protein